MDSRANTFDNKDPSCIIINTEANDLTKEADTIENLRSVIRDAKETALTTEIAISSLVPGYKCFLAKDMSIKVVTHTNLDKSCLSEILLHLNCRGDAILAKNFLGFIENNF